jgi:excisionase family DNA binding protein
LTVEETGHRLAVSVRTVRRLIRAGLPAHRVGGQVRIDVDELEEWIAENPAERRGPDQLPGSRAAAAARRKGEGK